MEEIRKSNETNIVGRVCNLEWAQLACVCLVCLSCFSTSTDNRQNRVYLEPGR